MNIPSALKREVLRRAAGRCEYCGLSQSGQEARFHIDHIQPITHAGTTELKNLALACVSCSLRKGARQEMLDPISRQVVPLFHPRAQAWNEHFEWKGTRVVGRTPTGRATVEALKMNRQLIQAIRSEESLRGRHPPPTHLA